MARWTLESIERRFEQLDFDETQIKRFFASDPDAPRAQERNPFCRRGGRHRFAGAGSVTMHPLRSQPPPAEEMAAVRRRRSSDPPSPALGWGDDGRKQQGARRTVATLVTEGDRVRRLVAEDVARRGAHLRKGLARPVHREQGCGPEGSGDDDVPPGREGGWDHTETAELFGVADQGQLFRPLSATPPVRFTPSSQPQSAPRGSAGARRPSRPRTMPESLQPDIVLPGAVEPPAAEHRADTSSPPSCFSTPKLRKPKANEPPKSACSHGAEKAVERFANARPVSGQKALMKDVARRKARARPRSAAPHGSPKQETAPRPTSALGEAPPASLPASLAGGKRVPRRVQRPRGVDSRTVPMRAAGRAAELEDAVNRKEYYYLHVRIMHSNETLARWRFDVTVTDVTFPECPLVQTFENLRLNPSMHVVFREPNDCILSPVDDLQWVRKPSDLYKHTLRVEVTGVTPNKTKVVDTLVYYGDNLPIPPPAHGQEEVESRGSFQQEYSDDDGQTADEVTDEDEGDAHPLRPTMWESAGQIRAPGTCRLGLRGRASPIPN
eukprot:TRINITY_DN33080_c0_g1_i1.p1 TRINITY_DN33080_c0_g1~~TRINITY_DN33080_c0_g1_i1.p1  ORF type:complete len:570 (+),score=107.15 TRINITY_DN33080_c0_g1_i1:54-1712(+)